MAVKEIARIADHYEAAISRLTAILKDCPKNLAVSWSAEKVSGWEALLYAFVKQAQSLEDLMIDMLNNRSLATAEGVNLDRIGEIVGASRAGLEDSDYRLIIYSQIAANNSKGRADDVMNALKVLVGNGPTLYWKDNFPAKFFIDQIGIGDPIEDLNDAVSTIDAAKAAGVGFSGFSFSNNDTYLGFQIDQRPLADHYSVITGTNFVASDPVTFAYPSSASGNALRIKNRGVRQYYAASFPYTSIGSGPSWRISVDDSDPDALAFDEPTGSTAFETFRNAVVAALNVVGGRVGVVDKNGVFWHIESTGAVNIDSISTQLAINLNTNVEIYKNTELSDFTTIAAEFEPFLNTSADQDLYGALNPYGIFSTFTNTYRLEVVQTTANESNFNDSILASDGVQFVDSNLDTWQLGFNRPIKYLIEWIDRGSEREARIDLWNETEPYSNVFIRRNGVPATLSDIQGMGRYSADAAGLALFNANNPNGMLKVLVSYAANEGGRYTQLIGV